MLRGIERNRIIVGAYTDKASGGICPMLAAHRNGGRTDLASFAVAWDAFTDARRPRLATRREVRTLRSFLEISLLNDEQHGEPLADVAKRIRAERAEHATRTAAAETPTVAEADRIDAAEITVRRRDTGERHRAAELRDRIRWAWMRPSRRYDEFKDLLATAEEQMAEQRMTDVLDEDAPLTPRR